MANAKIEQLVPKPLLDDLIRGSVVPFVGSGFSRNCEGPAGFVMPDWNELGKQVAADMPDYDYSGSPIDALSVYEERFKRPALVDRIRRACLAGKVFPGEAHRLFCDCFGSTVCTTNFDTLLEDAYRDAHIGSLVVVGESGLTLTNPDGATIVKVHGDFSQPDGMVVTEGDYDLFVSRNPVLCTFVSNLFITKTMLLIGYSLDDADMRQLLKVVQSRLGRLARPVYCIQIGATADDIARYKRRGVDVINVPKHPKVGYKESLIEFLRNLKAYVEMRANSGLRSNDEEVNQELVRPALDNRLCFVSCQADRVAWLKGVLDPLIRKYDIVPFWSDAVVPQEVDGTIAVAAALKKSAYRIFDITGNDRRVRAELEISVREASERTLVIAERNEAEPQLTDIEKVAYLSYWPDTDSGELSYGSGSELSNQLAGLFKSSLGLGLNDQLTDAVRLLEKGEFSAAVISAWTALERRFVDEVKRNAEKPNSQLIIERCCRNSSERNRAGQLRVLRNRIVHGTRRATKGEAKDAVDLVRHLLDRE